MCCIKQRIGGVWGGRNAPVRDRRGFTLLESVVALAIIALVAVAALASVGTQLRTEERARRTSEVEGLAEDRLAMVHLLNAQELQSLPDTVAAGQFVPPFNQYTWHITSTPIVSESYLNDVDITIAWPNGSYTMATRVYEPPMSVSAGSGTTNGTTGAGAGAGAGGGGARGGGAL